MPGVTKSEKPVNVINSDGNVQTLAETTKMTQDIILSIHDDVESVALYISMAMSASNVMWESVDKDTTHMCFTIDTSPIWENAHYNLTPWVGRLKMTIHRDWTTSNEVDINNAMGTGADNPTHVKTYLEDINFQMNKPNTEE